MVTGMKRQFIEAAARVMWAHVWDQRWSGKTGPGTPFEKTPGTLPDYARLEAAILLGKLEQVNGCELAVIVKAATDAEISRGGECASGCGCGPGTNYHDGGCVPVAVDIAEFASAVALEALGTGVRWTDDHEAFNLPCSDGGACGGYLPLTAPPRHKFVVPSIEFTYEEGEE